MMLAGRNVVITGASRGLGLAIAHTCVRNGARVLICGRDAETLEAARGLVIGSSTFADADERVIAVVADVARPEGVDLVADTAHDSFGVIHGLVNNAGIYGPIGRVEEVDWEEWLDAVRVNLYGLVLMCRALLPTFRNHGYGKIVNLSGGGATSPMPRFSAYGATKAAVVRFTETLAVETADAGIDVNAVAPGALNTQLLEQVLAAGPEAAGESAFRQAVLQKESGGTSPSLGADLCAFLLSAASDGISGRLLSAVWDDWAGLPNRRDELAAGDVYTLRRIVPSDRGLDWAG